MVDYDDAIFHRYDQHHFKLIRWILGQKIDHIMQYAALVLVGNEYLLERAKKAGAKRVEVLPTVIDLEKYPTNFFNNNDIFTIGWIGSPVTSCYLKLIMPALEEICKKNTARLVLIGAKQEELSNISAEYISWSEETEIKEIQKFDVGIMPLSDSAWEQGKCGFKLIQYMACGLPVVGSAVGVNKKIIQNGVNGYLATTIDEWKEALKTLKNDKDLCYQMGKAGRDLVEKEYCLQVTAPRLRDLIFSAVKGLREKE
jgi:glycosyltransferase involved in cell wall biosynthesis